jgi:hypothetical protein
MPLAAVPACSAAIAAAAAAADAADAAGRLGRRDMVVALLPSRNTQHKVLISSSSVMLHCWQPWHGVLLRLWRCLHAACGSGVHQLRHACQPVPCTLLLSVLLALLLPVSLLVPTMLLAQESLGRWLLLRCWLHRTSPRGACYGPQCDAGAASCARPPTCSCRRLLHARKHIRPARCELPLCADEALEGHQRACWRVCAQPCRPAPLEPTHQAPRQRVR